MDHERGELLAALEALYRERLADFVRVATAICGDPEHGSDAVQDGFTQAVRSIHRFRGASATRDATAE